MPQIDIRRLMEGGYEKVREPEPVSTEKPFLPAILPGNVAVSGEDEGGWLPHGPLRQLNFRKIVSKRTLMEELNRTIIFNSNVDLPDFIYRPDLLNYQFFASLADDQSHDRAFEAQSMLDAAIVPLDYNEGFPTLQNSPVWKQLPFEPEEAFRAFGLYVSQIGARQIGDIIAFEPEQVKDWFHEFVWLHRARAFDMFKVVHHQKVRISRIMDLEDDHFGLADRLLRQAKVRMAEEDFLNWDELKDPLKMAKFLDTMTKVQRAAVGLGSTTKGNDEVPKVPSVEVIMRQVAPKGEEVGAEVDNFDLLKESPDAVEMAQELIISVNKRAGS